MLDYKNIRSVKWNWFFSQRLGEEFSEVSLASEYIEEIRYYDKTHNSHYCDILYSDGTKKRIFNLNEIIF